MTQNCSSNRANINTMANDDELLLLLLILVYMIAYKQLKFPIHQYVVSVTYTFFEFSLNAWNNKRQYWMMQ